MRERRILPGTSSALLFGAGAFQHERRWTADARHHQRASMKAWAWRIAYAVFATLMVANAVALSVAIYWSVEADIVDLDYAPPALLTIPASNRGDARANQTTVTRAGQTLYF